MFTPCIATALCLIPMAVIAAIQGPTSADLYAVLGVAPATVIVIYYSLKKERTFELAASVFCGAGAFGAFFPGILLYYILRVPFETVIWQAWMGLGFLSALFGWFLTLATLKLAAAFSPWIASTFFKSYIPGMEEHAREMREDRNHRRKHPDNR